ncbi:MAG TPA: hypothetical protein VIA62_22030 [Thermoanaerobaculia bacterium]|nr:hypothetical protein [Thermoanaerobaculia bacterium]
MKNQQLRTDSRSDVVTRSRKFTRSREDGADLEATGADLNAAGVNLNVAGAGLEAARTDLHAVGTEV